MALVVFTGGARSGKSGAAHLLAAQRGALGTPVTFVVFGRPGDAEFEERVNRHRAERPTDWRTVEIASYADIDEMFRVDDSELVVVDCLGTLLGLCMEQVYDAFAEGGLGAADMAEAPPGFETEVTALLDRVVAELAHRGGDSVVITNEVGDGVVPAYATGRVFRDVLGRANRALIDRADVAYMCVAGRLIDLTAVPRTASWPRD